MTTLNTEQILRQLGHDTSESFVFLGWFDHITVPLLGSEHGTRHDLNDDNGRGPQTFYGTYGLGVGMTADELYDTYGQENLIVHRGIAQGCDAICVSEWVYRAVHGISVVDGADEIPEADDRWATRFSPPTEVPDPEY